MDISINSFDSFDDFIQRIKKQDKDDEKYILHNQMIPVSIGLFFISIIMLFNPVKSPLLLFGLTLVFLGLLSTLILLVKDYKTITQESDDLSLLSYLQRKEKRLKSWRSTPKKYQLTFTVFVSGLIMLILGNTGFIQEFSTGYIIVFISMYLSLLLGSWIIGEYFYRKRHSKKHKPLLEIISEQIKELAESEIIT